MPPPLPLCRYPVRVRLSHFLDYTAADAQADDSPLYIFDSSFDARDASAPLMLDYSVPPYFPDDLFSLVGERRRPPYRWFLVGPRRSGTTAHVDPLGTSAWNTVLQGRKRWALFPPGTPRAVAKGKTVICRGEDDEPVNYFVDHIPRLRRRSGRGGSSGGNGNGSGSGGDRYPGDTVFIPGGWWHAVINLDDTVAVTQNFCSPRNFDQVWSRTCTGRRKMAVSWRKRLREQHPELAARADALNAAAGFEEPQPGSPQRKRKQLRSR
ncbi:unnamed protein product, partial [Phaeothamnion confervicola]